MKKRDTGLFRFLIKQFRRWNGFRDWFASALDADDDRKTTLYIDLSKAATVRDLIYWLQILFSAGIATLGLVQSSSAVIIGAMLISPLMAPILSGGLALATGDLTLGVRAAANLFLSSLLAIGFAFLLVKLLPFENQTAEIMARTKPNTLDLVIALFSGAIGALATCRETKGVVTSIPGVAIAVALMPPLCVVGYGLGVGGDTGWKIASGGGLLYLTNLVAITFTAMLVFVLLRIDRKQIRDAVRLWRAEDEESKWWTGLLNRIPKLEKAKEVRSFSLRLLMILIPLIIIYVPLSQSFAALKVQFQKQQTQNKIKTVAEEYWKDAVASRPFSELEDLRVTEKGEKLEIYIRAFSNSEFTQDERALYINRLAGYLKRKPSSIALQVLIIPTAERNADVVAVASPTPMSVAQMKSEFLQSYKDALDGFTLTAPAQLIDYSVAINSTGDSALTIYYLSVRDIEPDGRAAMENNVRRLLNLQNLTLSLSRVSSLAVSLPFESNSAVFETDSDEINDLIANLRQYRNLRVRIMLSKTPQTEELHASRVAALKDFLFVQKSLAGDRVIFTESNDTESGNTYQLFLKK